MGRNALVLQPFGLGDCIFAQGVVRQLQFDRICWPVMDQYLDQLRYAYPDVTWCKENMTACPFVNSEMIAVPIRWSDTIMGVPYKLVMRAKYDMYSLDYKRWSEFAYWRRNPIKEAKLFQEIGIEPGDKFNLISMNYTSGFKMRAISVNNGLRTIYMNPINGYSMFDWALVIERATEIHFVSSASLYMLECLSPRAERICIYQREAHEAHDRYDYLFSKHKYIWI